MGELVGGRLRKYEYGGDAADTERITHGPYIIPYDRCNNLDYDTCVLGSVWWEVVCHG